MTDQHYYRSNDKLMVLAHSPEWEYQLYGVWVDGRGDEFMKLMWEALWSTMKGLSDRPLLGYGAIIMYRDKIRWTDGDIPLQAGVNEDGESFKKYRSIYSVTRDFIIGLTMYHDMVGNDSLLKDTHYPRLTRWYRMTSQLYHWRKFIIEGDEKSFNKYERKACRSIRSHVWTEKIRLWLVEKSRYYHWPEETKKIYWKLAHWFGFWPFVKFLHAMKAYTANNMAVKNELLKSTPKWNYAIRIMCDDILSSEDLEAIRNYQDCEGFQWGMEYWQENRNIPKTDQYQPAAHCLFWLMEREYGPNWREL